MSLSKVFMQFEDNEYYIRNVIDLIVQSLITSADRIKTEQTQALGEGFESVIRPWALVFLKDDTLFQTELSKRTEKLQIEERKWLDSIQVCRIDTSHQLRTILCALHLKNKEVSKYEPKQLNILNWIENERDGQPPSIIVAVDLLELISEGKKNYNRMQFMTVNNYELAALLAILVESCIFESTVKSDIWEQGLGIKVDHFTELVVTDKSFLPPLQKDDTSRDKFERTAIENLHKILKHYMDYIYTNPAA